MQSMLFWVEDPKVENQNPPTWFGGSVKLVKGTARLIDVGNFNGGACVLVDEINRHPSPTPIFRSILSSLNSLKL